MIVSGLNERIIDQARVLPGHLRLVCYIVKRSVDMSKNIQLLEVMDHRVELMDNAGAVLVEHHGMTESEARALFGDLKLEHGV